MCSDEIEATIKITMILVDVDCQFVCACRILVSLTRSILGPGGLGYQYVPGVPRVLGPRLGSRTDERTREILE